MSVDERKFTFTWKIENYSFCYLKNGEKLESPVFTAESLGGSKWKLRLFPSGSNRECIQHIGCYLIRTLDDIYPEEISVDFSVDIACSDSSVLCSRSFTEFRVFSAGSPWGWKRFMEIEKIRNTMKNISDKTLVIHCTLKTKNSMKNPASEYEAKTVFDVRKNMYRLNLQFICQNTFSEAKRINLHDKSEYEIICQISLHVITINIKKIQEKSKMSRFIDCEISLLNVDGNKIISRRDTHLFDSVIPYESWNFPSFITKQHLEGSENEDQMHEKYTLLFEFCVSDGIKFENGETSTDADSNLILRKDYENILLKDEYSDVQLRVGEEIFKAHRCILGARSPVFHSMFQQDMLENKTGIVDITDIDPAILQSFLKFIYCGMLDEMNDDIAIKLLIVSDKYQVQSLLEKCVCFLKSNLTVENACEIFQIADMVNHKFLKSIALDYIASHTEQIMPSFAWMEWMKENVGLTTEIYMHLSQNFDLIPKQTSNN